MNAIKSLIAMSAVVIAAGTASAQSIGLGEPGTGGTGCPQGSVSTTLSQNSDNAALTILFDSFIAEAGGTTGKTIDRKTCNISIPVRVPNGYSVALISLDYRGFNAIPRGAYTEFNAEYFYAGSTGPRYTRRYNGALEDEFLINNSLLASSWVWSPCGQSINFRVNASALARTNPSRQQTMMSIDSVDASARLLYNFRIRRCF